MDRRGFLTASVLQQQAKACFGAALGGDLLVFQEPLAADLPNRYASLDMRSDEG